VQRTQHLEGLEHHQIECAVWDFAGIFHGLPC
jgi:hypothetical protein